MSVSRVDDLPGRAGWRAYRVPADGYLVDAAPRPFTLGDAATWHEAIVWARIVRPRSYTAALCDAVEAVLQRRAQLASGLTPWGCAELLDAAAQRARHEAEETRCLRATGLPIEQRLRCRVSAHGDLRIIAAPSHPRLVEETRCQ